MGYSVHLFDKMSLHTYIFFLQNHKLSDKRQPLKRETIQKVVMGKINVFLL